MATQGFEFLQQGQLEQLGLGWLQHVGRGSQICYIMGVHIGKTSDNKNNTEFIARARTDHIQKV